MAEAQKVAFLAIVHDMLFLHDLSTSRLQYCRCSIGRLIHLKNQVGETPVHVHVSNLD
jgi:hypothetical protein